MTSSSQRGEVTPRSDPPGLLRACQQAGALQALQQELRLRLLICHLINQGLAQTGTPSPARQPYCWGLFFVSLHPPTRKDPCLSFPCVKWR